jgi:sugar-specific transcriptional regulator TrmB
MDTAEYLKKLGLTEYETKVYTILSNLKKAKAKEISDLSKVPQSKIYEVLMNLSNKGLVNIIYSKPKWFQATPPSIAIKKLLKQKEDQINLLKTYENSVINEIISKQYNINKDKFKVEMFFGRDTYIQIGTELIKSSQKRCYIMVNRIAFPNVIKMLSSLHSKKCDVKILVRQIDKSNAEYLMKLIRCGIQIKKHRISGIKMMISDEQGGICVMNPRNPSSYTSMILQGKEFSDALASFYSVLWDNAEKLSIGELKKLL